MSFLLLNSVCLFLSLSLTHTLLHVLISKLKRYSGCLICHHLVGGGTCRHLRTSCHFFSARLVTSSPHVLSLLLSTSCHFGDKMYRGDKMYKYAVVTKCAATVPPTTCTRNGPGIDAFSDSWSYTIGETSHSNE